MGEPRRVLSRFDAVAIIVSVVIGAGIFSIPGIVAGHLADPALILAFWAAGGVIALAGALCYAELATAYPSSGGEYRFLTRAYGQSVGFMFAWARMTVMQTGSIAVLAFVFGDFATRMLDLGAHSSAIYGASAILLATAINLAGVREMKFVQGTLFMITMLGVLGVIAAGILGPSAGHAAVTAAAGHAVQTESGGMLPSAGLAMIFVLFTYGGWNEAAYISGEMAGNPRNIAWSLIASVGLITALYLAINVAYLNALGPQGMADSETVASDVLETAAGNTSAALMSILIMIVVLASINVTVFTGARANFAVGKDFSLFGFLAGWSRNGGAPVPGLLLQAAIALGLVTLGSLNRRGLETAVDYLSPVFWFFLLLTIMSIFVLRKREPERERPFRTPFYPLTPAAFCLVAGGLLYSSLNYTGIGALAGVAVLAAGIPFLIWARRVQAMNAEEPARQSLLTTTAIKEKYEP